MPVQTEVNSDKGRMEAFTARLPMAGLQT